MSCKCLNSCVESWSSCLSCSQTLVCTKCSPRTNVEGQTHVSGKQPKLPLFSFSTFRPHAVWTPLITGLVLKTDPVKCFDKPKKKMWRLAGSSLLWWMDIMMSVSAALFRHIWSAFCLSFFEMTCSLSSCHLPPESQPTSGPHSRPRQMSRSGHTGGGGTGGGPGRVTPQTEGERAPQKKSGKSHWPWPLCLGWLREILQACICWVQVCGGFFSHKHLLLLSVASGKPGTFIKRQIIPVTKHTLHAATFFTDWFIVWSIKCPTTITPSPMWCI